MDNGLEFIAREIGPEGVAEKKFSIRGLPEQKV
jgi:hypothetical protein